MQSLRHIIFELQLRVKKLELANFAVYDVTTSSYDVTYLTYRKKFFENSIFELLTRDWENENSIFELLTRDWENVNSIFELLTRDRKNVNSNFELQIKRLKARIPILKTTFISI